MEQHLAENLKRLQQYYFNKPIKKDVVQLLSGGYSWTTNYRVEDDGKTYLARFMSNKQPLANREKECLITEHVGKVGIGPKVYYQNPQQGILITEFIQGRTPNHQDMVNEPIRPLIIANIKALHQTAQLDFPRSPLLSTQIQEMLKKTNSTISQNQLDELELVPPLNRLFDCEADHLTAALIHGDLYPKNILIAENRVYFIDWTSAGIGDPFVDISWHAMCFPLSFHHKFLRYYFDHIDIMLQHKLLCYYCLHLFRLAVWGIEKATRLSNDCENLLVNIMKKGVLFEPHGLLVDFFNDKITLKKPDDFLLFASTMFRFLSKFTKEDTFISLVEELS